VGAIVQPSETSLDIEPGKTGSIRLDLHNDGSVVDRYTFQALGNAADWTTFSPHSVSLFPGTAESVTVTFAPPRRPETTSGLTPVGIRVIASEDREGSVVEEVTVNVAAFSDVGVELLPLVASGSISGRAQLAVDNRSNCDYRAELSASDAKSMLRFSFGPRSIEVPPGGAVFVKVRIQPVKRFWRGPPKSYPYQVSLADRTMVATQIHEPAAGPSEAAPPADEGPHKPEITADGSMLQERLIPSWVLKALAVLAILALLWFLLVKPQIQNTAKNEVNKQLASAGISGSTTTTAPPPPPTTTSPTTAPTTTTTVNPNSPTAGSPTNGQASATGNGTTVLATIAKGQTLKVTDILVQNPAGQTGDVELANNGTPLMQWSMANFRDLDYHWITPTEFTGPTVMQMTVSGCTGPCSPSIFYAGLMVSG
jgi:hypothetical protein